MTATKLGAAWNGQTRTMLDYWTSYQNNDPIYADWTEADWADVMSRRVTEVITEIDTVTAAAAEIQRANAVAGLLGCYTAVTEAEIDAWQTFIDGLQPHRVDLTEALGSATG